MVMSFKTNVLNKLWKIRSSNMTPLIDFKVAPQIPEEDRPGGDFASIFFENQEGYVAKWLHYLPIYDRLFAPFREKPVRFLEIGVQGGGSLAMWRRYFGAEAIITGIDINPACAQFDGRFANVRIGSQDDPKFLLETIAEMGGVDIVLDDGSHIATHQRVSFETLFPELGNGGLYVMEDLQTAYWPWMEGGLKRRGTAIEFLKDKVDDMHRHYWQDRHAAAPVPEPIESIEFFDSIAVVRKNLQQRRSFTEVPRSAQQ